MQIRAPETRREIACRLQEIISSPFGTVDETDSSGTCDFFQDDLAFDAPYEAMIGVVLNQDEVERLREVMNLLNHACERRGRVMHSAEGQELAELQKASAELLRIMRRNDELR